MIRSITKGGCTIKRIARTAFPGKFTKKGSLRYIAVPSSVEERMGLKEGDYLDVVISWPMMEEYDLEGLEEGVEKTHTEKE